MLVRLGGPTYLASPAESYHTPFLDRATRLLINLFDPTRDLWYRRWWGTDALEESTELLALLWGIWGIPFVRDRVPTKDIGYEDLKFMFVVAGVGQDISALAGEMHK